MTKPNFQKSLSVTTAVFLSILVVTLFVSGCDNDSDNGDAQTDNNATVEPVNDATMEIESAVSSKSRDPNPAAKPEDISELVAGNNAFAFDLYHAVNDSTQSNICFSPYSLSVAFGMLWAGARGDTETQIADVMHFTLSQDALHPAFNAFDLSLAKHGYMDPDTLTLSISNEMWLAKDRHFEAAFLDTLSENYGAGGKRLDFATDPEKSRLTINEWIFDQTGENIKDMLPPGSISGGTALVITNAFYLKADWMNKFDLDRTMPRDFYLMEGGSVKVETMIQSDKGISYAKGIGYQAVLLPYKDGISMLIIHPDIAEFENIENSLSVEFLKDVGLAPGYIALNLPKFVFEYQIALKKTFSDMGMRDVFAFGEADFSGIDGTESLFVEDVIQKSFINLNEKGTEAGSVSVIPIPSPEIPIQVNINSPFFFFIRHDRTGTVLFMGKVMNPLSP